MALGNELIIKGTDQNSDPVEYSIKNINPAVSISVLRQAAINFNGLTENNLAKIIYRQDVDITSPGNNA